MSSTFLPPHLTAQTLASQPAARPQPQRAAEGGFEALALRSAGPGQVIAPRPIEPKAGPQQQQKPQQQAPSPFMARPAAAAPSIARPAPASATYAPAAPAPAPAIAPMTSATPALDEVTRYTRPGSRLDIRV